MCIGTEALTTRETALRYIHMIHMCVCEYLCAQGSLFSSPNVTRCRISYFSKFVRDFFFGLLSRKSLAQTLTVHPTANLFRPNVAAFVPKSTLLAYCPPVVPSRIPLFPTFHFTCLFSTCSSHFTALFLVGCYSG